VPWGQEVEEARKAVTDRSPEALRDAYREARELKAEIDERHDAELRPLHARIAALESFITDLYDQGYSAGPLRCIDGARVECSADVSAKVVDMPALIRWLKATGREDYLTVHAQRAQSLAKQALEVNDPMPEGVEVRGYYKVKFVGPKK
jgi:hypothetical protein